MKSVQKEAEDKDYRGQTKSKNKILWAGVRIDKQMKNTEDIHASHFEFLRFQQHAWQNLFLESKTFPNYKDMFHAVF